MLISQTMPSQCPTMSVARSRDDASLNVTELLLQRQQNSPKDDLDRLLKCWGYLDCGDCHRSDGFCGWCPIVRLHLIISLMHVCVFIALRLTSMHSPSRASLYRMINSRAHFRCCLPLGTTQFVLWDPNALSFGLQVWGAKSPPSHS